MDNAFSLIDRLNCHVPELDSGYGDFPCKETAFKADYDIFG